jgi:serine/threonine-protein kinase RsbW
MIRAGPDSMDPLARTTLAVTGTTAGVRSAAEAFEAFLAGRAVPQAARRRCLVALDELLSNIVRHGRPDAADPIFVTFTLMPDRLELELADPTAPFDPLQQAPPDSTGGIDARPLGGLGIALVRGTMTDVRYERRDGRNVVTLTARLADLPS